MLKRHRFKPSITRQFIKLVILNPEHIDGESDFPKVIASRSIDSKHILRVVYRRENDIILIITFYPAEQGRYYEKKIQQ